jgi:hypothetical protein
MESKVKDGNFYVVQSFMVKDLKLKGLEKEVYAIIYGFSQADQKFDGSLQYLADWTLSTKQGVVKVLKALLDKGLINKEEEFKCGVKFVKYYTTEFNGGIKHSLTGGIKLSLTNNIDNNKINYNIEEKNIIKKETETEFEELWKIYPNKQGKTNAFKSYDKARKKGVEFEAIKKGLENYIEYCKAKKMEKQYIKHGSTWFNQECWNDEYNLKGDNYGNKPKLPDWVKVY